MPSVSLSRWQVSPANLQVEALVLHGHNFVVEQPHGRTAEKLAGQLEAVDRRPAGHGKDAPPRAQPPGPGDKLTVRFGVAYERQVEVVASDGNVIRGCLGRRSAARPLPVASGVPGGYPKGGRCGRTGPPECRATPDPDESSATRRAPHSRPSSMAADDRCLGQRESGPNVAASCRRGAAGRVNESAPDAQRPGRAGPTPISADQTKAPGVAEGPGPLIQTDEGQEDEGRPPRATGALCSSLPAHASEQDAAQDLPGDTSRRGRRSNAASEPTKNRCRRFSRGACSALPGSADGRVARQQLIHGSPAGTGPGYRR